MNNLNNRIGKHLGKFTILNIVLVIAIVGVLGVTFAAINHVGPFDGQESGQTSVQSTTGAGSKDGTAKDGNDVKDGNGTDKTTSDEGTATDTPIAAKKTSAPAPSPTVTTTPADVRQHASDTAHKMTALVKYNIFFNDSGTITAYEWLRQQQQLDLSTWNNDEIALTDQIKAGTHFDDSQTAEESAAAIKNLDDAYTTWERETWRLLNVALNGYASSMAQSAINLQQTHPGYCEELVPIVKKRPATGETQSTFEAQNNWHNRLSEQWMQCEARAADPAK